MAGLSSAEKVDASELEAMLEKAGGLSAAGAAGVVGNWVQESSLDSNDDGASGLGLAQWGGSRATAEQSFAAANKESPFSYDAQVGFTIDELKGQPALLKTLQTTTNPSEAALLVEDQFEEPAGTTGSTSYNTDPVANTAGRESYAQDVLSDGGSTLNPAKGTPQYDMLHGLPIHYSIAQQLGSSAILPVGSGALAAGEGGAAAGAEGAGAGVAASDVAQVAGVGALTAWLSNNALKAALYAVLLIVGAVLIIRGLGGNRQASERIVPVPV